MYEIWIIISITQINLTDTHVHTGGVGGGGVLLEKLDGGKQLASQNPYPIYVQNLWYSLPFLWHHQIFDTLFLTWPLNQNPVIISSLVQTNVTLL